jgi:vacuolar-type H+-ATPase subunit F/Vma7
MLRPGTLSVLVALALPIALHGVPAVQAAPDPISRQITAQPTDSMTRLVADVAASRPKQVVALSEDAILYDILSDQISEMRRKSALPAVMCIAASNGDGSAETVSRTVMARLEADNAQVEHSLFTLKPATDCQTTGQRVIDRETRERAMMIVAGPMESDMKDLMAGCGDFVGGFVRAAGDSDFDFYSVNGGDVARKLGCELAQ